MLISPKKWGKNAWTKKPCKKNLALCLKKEENALFLYKKTLGVSTTAHGMWMEWLNAPNVCCTARWGKKKLFSVEGKNDTPRSGMSKWGVSTTTRQESYFPNPATPKWGFMDRNGLFGGDQWNAELNRLSTLLVLFVCWHVSWCSALNQKLLIYKKIAVFQIVKKDRWQINMSDNKKLHGQKFLQFCALMPGIGRIFWVDITDLSEFFGFHFHSCLLVSRRKGKKGAIKAGEKGRGQEYYKICSETWTNLLCHFFQISSKRNWEISAKNKSNPGWMFFWHR